MKEFTLLDNGSECIAGRDMAGLCARHSAFSAHRRRHGNQRRGRKA